MLDWKPHENIDKIIYEYWAPNFSVISKKLISSNYGTSSYIVLINDQYILKLPNNRRSNFHIKRESLVLTHLNQLKLPLAPKVIAKPSTLAEENFHWIVYKYINGEVRPQLSLSELRNSVAPLSNFLILLQNLTGVKDLSPSKSTYLRGGDLRERACVTKKLIQTANLRTDKEIADKIWGEALEAVASTTHSQLIHGDLHPANLVLSDHRLCGVIDFGCSSIGDRSCDIMAGWTIFDGFERESFFDSVSATQQEIIRARGWALTFALGAIQDFPKSQIGKIGQKTLRNLFSEVD